MLTKNNNIHSELFEMYYANGVATEAKAMRANDYGDSGYLGQSKAMKEAQERTGRTVTFYNNGEQFNRGIKVSLIVGKTFRTFDLLCDYLNSRTNIPLGVRYIFTMKGEPISSLDQLQHNQSYVISGTRQFQFLPYGQSEALRRPHQVVSAIANSVNREDLKLMLPLSPKQNLNIFSGSLGKYKGLSQPIIGQDGKIVTIINGREPNVQSRVLLNLRNPGTFEIVLKDLGQAVQVPNPLKMFTPKGREVRSISQLRRELIASDSLFIESSLRARNGSKSKSLESVYNYRDRTKVLTTVEGNYNTAHGDELFDRSQAFGSTSSINPENNVRDRNIKSKNGVPLVSSEPMSRTIYRRESEHAISDQTSPKFMSKSSPEKEESHSNAISDRPLNESMTISGHEATSGSRGEQENKKAPNDFIYSSWEEGISLREERNRKPFRPEIDTRELRSSLERAYIESVDKQSRSGLFEAGSLVNTLPKPALQVPRNIVEQEREEEKEKEEKEKEKEDVRPAENMDKVRSQTSTLKRNAEPRANGKANVQNVQSSLNEGPLDTEEEHESDISKMNFNKDSEGDGKSFPNSQLHYPTINMKHGLNLPSKNIFLDRVFGYQGDTVGSNLLASFEDELMYYVAAIVVLWDPEKNTQRFYCEHTQDIECVARHSNTSLVASSQRASPGRSAPFSVQVNIWNSTSLETLAVLIDPSLGKSILSISFSANESFLSLLSSSETFARLFIWCWKRDQLICSINHTLERGELLYGCHFHPTEQDILVTFGQRHLVLWQLNQDMADVMQKSSLCSNKMKAHINVLIFLHDDTILAGDSKGCLSIWAPAPRQEMATVEYIQIEFRAHQSPIISLHTISDGTTVSGDVDGNVKAWDINDGQFNLVNAVKLPETSGAINSLCDLARDDVELYIGTSMNQILFGSAARATNFSLVFEDSTISIASHPSGKAVAVGTIGGLINILSAKDGTLISQLPICQSSIGCLAYSPDGDILAAGSSDGVMYLLPSSQDGYTYEKVSVLKVCRGDDVKGIWDNEQLKDVVNLSCHCSPAKSWLASGDEEGFLRFFTYPCVDPRSGFFERKIGTGSVSEVRFLHDDGHLVTANMNGLILRWKVDPVDVGAVETIRLVDT
ncbi:putative echinoderm microtubule-associated protein [Halotydeus destructor]|nr:putative echinoderm microtubule-associated protein [Halotydeus destructor]